MCIRDSSEVFQIGQFALNPGKIPAEKVPVEQSSVHLIGPEIGLSVLVFAVIPVRKGHLGVGCPLTEAIGEDLIHHPAAQQLRGGKAGLIDGQLIAVPLRRTGEKPLSLIHI